MKQIHSLLLIASLLVPLMLLSNPVQAMHIDQMETIVENARSSVDTALAQLQSAITTGDPQTVKLAQDALDLAVANYAIASESLEKARAGETVSDSIMLACNDIADGVSNVCSLIADGSLNAAQLAYNIAEGTYGSLPPPVNPDQIPAGLGDIQAQILTASTEAAAILAGGGTGSGTADSLGTSAASPI